MHSSLGQPTLDSRPESDRDARLQVLAKFPQHRLTQELRIEFTGFCKLDNFFGDFLISKIASIVKLKSFASHFKCDAHDPRGLRIEIGAGKKLRDGHDPRPSYRQWKYAELCVSKG